MPNPSLQDAIKEAYAVAPSNKVIGYFIQWLLGLDSRSLARGSDTDDSSSHASRQSETAHARGTSGGRALGLDEWASGLPAR